MPRVAAVKVLPSNNKTRWTLLRDDLDTPGVKGEAGLEKMAVNGFYFDNREQSLPRYESYDGSQYSSQSGRLSSQAGYRPPESVSNYDGFDFNMGNGNVNGMPLDDHRNQRISVNTRVARPPQQQQHQGQDAVSQHLLYETALMDSQTFEILEISEVDALKKEHVRLNSRIEAAQRKLTLESKVRDAAQNLQRLYTTNKRPDTPQNPDSPKKSRTSLLATRARSGSRTSLNGEAAGQADSEVLASVKKVDELHEQIESLLDRRQYVERKLLRHTAAVLAEEANKNVESAVPGLHRGHHQFGDDDDDVYTPNEFDGIRDILRGMPAGASNKVQQHEQQLASMQERLEKLNSQLRSVISEADLTLGNKSATEVPLDQGEDSTSRVENRFARLEDSVHTLQSNYNQMQDSVHTLHSNHTETQDSLYALQSNHAEAQDSLQTLRSDHAQAQNSLQTLQSDHTQTQESLRGLQSEHTELQDSVEHQLEGLNTTLYHAILTASESQPVPGLQQPPQPSGHDHQAQIDYMEESLLTMEQLIQQQAHLNSAGATRKLEEYDNVITGLWDILQSDVASSPKLHQEDDDREPPPTPFIESFSLQAFNSRVQNLFDRAQAAKEQQEILRRQIQQQRELNEKGDSERDAHISDLTAKHDTLTQEHSTLAQEHDTLGQEHGFVQQELANYIVKHEGVESQATQSQNELMAVMTELEEMRKTMDAKAAEREEVDKKLREQMQVMSAQVSDADHLESEVATLKMELVQAQADLDAAHGTREQRKGAQAGQVAQLERELSEMTTEFQELTKESIELEKEREQLDTLIDGLRDRCDILEGQLGDEKLRSAGIRSPGMPNGGEREGTSMMVLRQEFKKMMREQRGEAMKMLRTEQEERRRVEGELRKLRQANGPLVKSLQSASGTATPVSTT